MPKEKKIIVGNVAIKGANGKYDLEFSGRNNGGMFTIPYSPGKEMSYVEIPVKGVGKEVLDKALEGYTKKAETEYEAPNGAKVEIRGNVPDEYQIRISKVGSRNSRGDADDTTKPVVDAADRIKRKIIREFYPNYGKEEKQ